MTLTTIEMIGRNHLDGLWHEGNGKEWVRTSPATGKAVWRGTFSDQAQIELAIRSAEQAFESWRMRPFDERAGYCREFAEFVSSKKEDLARLIASETGKPLWEARTEVATVIAKVSNSIEAIHQRRSASTEITPDFVAATRYRPLGVMLVLGPYNLPAHLPGSHIVPALLSGNTIVFKPSEWTPSVGQWLVEAWERASLPRGVMNLIHGSAEVAIAAASNDILAGVLFTGSYRAGASLHRLLSGKPEKILALEMGGNNPVVVHGMTNYREAALTMILSSFISSGQRCTCSRRLIISGDGTYDRIVEQLCDLVPKIRVGLPFDDPEPFMGPLIHGPAADKMLEVQQDLKKRGATVLVEMKRGKEAPSLLTPGVIAVEKIVLDDEEHFGPLLLVQKANGLDEAISIANKTRFGLAAGFIGESQEDYQFFFDRIRAGVVNWNRPTTGASGRLAFGGIGASGNHRPSGFFAADYCSYPIASMESTDLRESRKSFPGLDLLS